jgi:hypothetical protein
LGFRIVHGLQVIPSVRLASYNSWIQLSSATQTNERGVSGVSFQSYECTHLIKRTINDTLGQWVIIFVLRLFSIKLKWEMSLFESGYYLYQVRTEKRSVKMSKLFNSDGLWACQWSGNLIRIFGKYDPDYIIVLLASSLLSMKM